ncbi:hypothetical protein K469DRAFT_710214 [Zopfia rhizophila CBS 207.26]|uniref:Uncharacterized protein n=1 Tax=Zopfia rhizophila CBS 207.26 TaxID=1314779 RepID=A0A6A6E053_9PEZI|nr:hypothetical protein K469DRAFT_710214 [Zopfia rhizophila CBS 207.26]
MSSQTFPKTMVAIKTTSPPSSSQGTKSIPLALATVPVSQLTQPNTLLIRTAHIALYPTDWDFSLNYHPPAGLTSGSRLLRHHRSNWLLQHQELPNRRLRLRLRAWPQTKSGKEN